MMTLSTTSTTKRSLLSNPRQVRETIITTAAGRRRSSAVLGGIKTAPFVIFLLCCTSPTFFLGPAAVLVEGMASSSPSWSKTYDLVVVGGGSAGLTAAKFAAGTLKKSVVIVEGDRLGGDCTWTGCVPSKSLLASARASKMARSFAVRNSRSIGGNGSSVPPTDFAAVRAYFRTNQQQIYERDDSPQALAKYGIDTVRGTATLASPTTVQVVVTPEDGGDIGDPSAASTTTATLTAGAGIVLCTGAKPRRPEIPGLEQDGGVDYLTYEGVWELEALPKRLTVVGGGPVGCELAQAFARLGSKVTVVATRGLLLPREDPAVSNLLRQVFEEDEGIRVVDGRLSRVAKNGDGTHTATVSRGGEAEEEQEDVIGDVLLLSTGRVPNTRGLGLEGIGVRLDGHTGGIAVNDRLQTSVNTIYAAGDCTGDRQFTHYAGFQGAIAARNILLPLSDLGVLKDVPAVTFTSPEVASVGYTEAAARAEFGDDAVLVSCRNLDEVDRAVCDGQTRGMIKVVYRKRGGQILGATIMAPVAGELIGEIAVAMRAGMSFPSLSRVVHPYPSYGIALQMMAADSYYEEVGKLRGLYGFLKRLGL